MQVRAVDFVVVNVADMDRAIAFYRDTLGFPVAYSHAGMWTELESSPVTIALMLKPEGVGENATIALAVPDVYAAVEEFRAAGHSIAMEPFESPVCHMGAIVDADGNALILHQRKDGSAG